MLRLLLGLLSILRNFGKFLKGGSRFLWVALVLQGWLKLKFGRLSFAGGMAVFVKFYTL